MPKFAYTAIDASGKQKSGVLSAASTEDATQQIKSMILFVTSLAPAAEKAGAAKGKGKARGRTASATRKKPVTIGRIVGQKGLSVFTRQLATLLQAGLPLLRSIEVLMRQEKNPSFKYVLEELAENVRSGNTFSDGLLQHPKVFNRLYVNMIKAGEAGGVLDVVLNRLARFMEKSIKIKGKVKSAMVYPIIVLTIAIAILTFLMIFVVPKFQEIFDELLDGAPLPVLTRVVMNTSYFVRDNVLITLGIIIVFVIVIKVLKSTNQGARFVDKMMITMPPVGDLFKKAAIARFSRTFGTLLSSGVPILQCLTITRDTIGNRILMDAIEKVHDRVKEGDSVSAPLEASKVFPTMVTSMIDVGEETGELPEMLNRIADTYDEEVDNAVAALTSIIEPIMIVILALIVGTIVIALFLPIIGVIENLSS
jgi:type IV pilus assembly protein PilC